MTDIEIVYGIHKFTAKNVDEISFNVGEKIFVIEKDEGYNDGWWQGRNEKGEIGLFPVTYTSSTSLQRKQNSISSVNSISFSKNIEQLVQESLLNPLLNKSIEEWTSQQVCIWLIQVGFDQDIAYSFRDQEISGDVLLELTLDSLKELQISTFGKRFKLQHAINLLRQEFKKQKNNKQQIQPSSRPSIPLDMDLIASSPRLSTLIEQHQKKSFQRNSPLNGFTNKETPIDNKYHHVRSSNVSTHHSTSSTHQLVQRPVPTHQIPSHPIASTHQLPSLINKNHLVSKPSEEPTSDVPDMEGWLYKQGDKYKNWNKRWFVLKSNNLFYFKNPKAVRMKGIINLKGYRIDVDESIYPGKYCFKAQHERERTFYFYTEHEKSMKDWLKSLMKATIERDYTTPVMSSSTVPTISLEQARKMRPRPPSTIFLAQENKHLNHQFSLLSIEKPVQELPEPKLQRIMSKSFSDYSVEPTRFSDSGFNSNPTRLSQAESSGNRISQAESSNRFSQAESSTRFSQAESSTRFSQAESSTRFSELTPATSLSRSVSSHDPYRLSGGSIRPKKTKSYYLDWINQNISHPIQTISDLKSGSILLEFLEHLSSEGIPPPKSKLDPIIVAFNFMNAEGIALDSACTIRDVANGNEIKMMHLLESIEYWHKTQSYRKKIASGGTFGEEDQCKLRELEVTVENTFI